MSAVARRIDRRRRSRLPLYLLVGIVLVAGGAVLWRSHARHTTSTNSILTANDTSKDSTPAITPHTDSGLQTIVTNWAAQQPVRTGVVVKELTGSLRTAESSSEASFVPASTYKIYVAYAVLHAIEQGTYTLDSVMNDGNTIETDMNYMILNSDNDAARTLGFLIGWKNINALLKSIGITHTNLYNYVPPSTLPVGQKYTTASDLAAVLTKLQAGQLLNANHTQLLLGLMKNQHYRQRIPAGVPSGVAVADKPGWLTVAEGDGINIQNDAAIVYGPKSTYILVITTQGTQMQPLATLSQQVYEYLQG